MRLITALLASSFIPLTALAGCRPACPVGRSDVNGTCVRDDVADFIVCIRNSNGAQLTSDRGNSLQAEAEYAGAKARTAADLKDKLEQVYPPQSAENARLIIRACYSKSGQGELSADEPPRAPSTSATSESSARP